MVIWRDFFKKIHTMMKQDSIAPFRHLKAASNHPKVYKLQSLKGEMLRNRRLASDDVIVRSIDESILEGFVSIGYNRRTVVLKMLQIVNELNENYTDEYVKIMDDTVDGYRKRYGGGIEFNRIYTYG